MDWKRWRAPCIRRLLGNANVAPRGLAAVKPANGRIEKSKTLSFGIDDCSNKIGWSRSSDVSSYAYCLWPSAFHSRDCAGDCLHDRQSALTSFLFALRAN